MIDWGLVAGVSSFGMVALKFLWEASDRYDQKLASTILASGKVKNAVGDVAVRAIIDSKKCVVQDIYDAQLGYHEEKLERVISDVATLSRYVMSDELPKKIAAAIESPMRRKNTREES